MKTLALICLGIVAFLVSFGAEAKSHCPSGQLYRPTRGVCLTEREFHRELGDARQRPRHMAQHRVKRHARVEVAHTTSHHHDKVAMVDIAETEDDVQRLEGSAPPVVVTPATEAEKRAALELSERMKVQEMHKAPVAPEIVDPSAPWAGSLYASFSGKRQ